MCKSRAQAADRQNLLYHVLLAVLIVAGSIFFMASAVGCGSSPQTADAPLFTLTSVELEANAIYELEDDGFTLDGCVQLEFNVLWVPVQLTPCQYRIEGASCTVVRGATPFGIATGVVPGASSEVCSKWFEPFQLDVGATLRLDEAAEDSD